MTSTNSLIDVSKYNDDENYKKLERKINKLLELYDTTSNRKEKQEILENLNEVKSKLNISSINSSISYPDYNDNKFIEKLITKKEFAMNKIAKEDKDKIKTDFFELTNNQKFLKKLISPETPYRSIYLYHSVGVGKTCASIQISHNFKKYYKKKALILLPLKLKDNFRKGLFDITKLENDNMEQCLGNYYLHDIVGRDKMEVSDIKLKVKKMINNEYEILSFGEFGNIFKRIKDNSKRNDFIRNIRNYFDERVIIVDEVHNMRYVNEEDQGKEVSKIFHEMLELLKNNALVLLSATPMFDNYEEIKFILNSLLIQNGEKKLTKNDKIFDNNKLNPEFEKKLKKVSNNFISYMRGENPFTFPLRLYPSVNDDSRILKSNDYPKLDVYGNKISKEDQIKYLELIRTDMSNLQQKIYNRIQISDNTNSNLNDDDDEENTDIQQRVQISNIVYGSNEDIKKTYGNEGLKSIFKIQNSKKGEYKVEYKKKDEILKYSNLEKYSPKIKLLVKNIKKAEGIVLVYSRYLASGVIPIAIALEHSGFHKYGGRNILKQGSRENKRGSYVIISGNTFLSPDNTKEIIECTNKNNKDGDKIKVILITESGTEGLDLKNVREIHIFDPWYNVNRIEQVIGRGVRNYSHIDLQETKRNTTIYQYVNLTQDNKRESIDFRTYRIAENKQKKISELEKIMKNNAIDCNLNINSNKFDDLEPVKILTSRNKLINKFNINDKDYSRLCNYSKCDIKCENKIDIQDLDNTTYKKEIINYDIDLLVKYIKKHFSDKQSAKIEDFDDFMKSKNLTNKEILYFALDNLVRNKIVFRGPNNRKGYLIYKSVFYIFQPLNIKDEKILTEERTKEKITKHQKLDISKYDLFNVDNNTNNESFKDYDKYLNDSINNIKNLLFFDDEDMTKYEEFIYDMLVDSMSKKEFKILIKNILKKNIKDSNIQKNIIESLKRGYYILDNENIILNYYTDKFICLNGSKIENCSPIQETSSRKSLKKKLSSITNNIEKLGYLEIIKDESIFKMIDLKKKANKKSVSGTKCLVTSTIKTEDLVEYIEKYDKNIVKDKNELKQKFNKKKYNKPNLCMLYQLTLRKSNTNNKINFVRPILNNYLNKI